MLLTIPNEFSILNVHLHYKNDTIHNLQKALYRLIYNHGKKKLFCIGDFNRNMNDHLYRQKLDTLSIGVVRNNKKTMTHNIPQLADRYTPSTNITDHVLYSCYLIHDDPFLFHKRSIFTEENESLQDKTLITQIFHEFYTSKYLSESIKNQENNIIEYGDRVVNNKVYGDQMIFKFIINKETKDIISIMVNRKEKEIINYINITIQVILISTQRNHKYIIH